MKILAFTGLFSAVISGVIYGSYHFVIWYNKGFKHVSKKAKKNQQKKTSHMAGTYDEENDFEGLEPDDVVIPQYYAENNGY